MSKSRGNVITPEEIVEKHGADALRQWAASGAATGSDIMFNWNDVISASRFQTKMWNIARFVHLQLRRHPYDRDAPAVALADRWLLDCLAGTVADVTNALEAYQFDRALKSIREFAWDILADNYIELVKGRLYSDDPSREGACRVLETAIDTLCRLMAPFIPFFAEECYSYLGRGSVHSKEWPGLLARDPDARGKGDLLVKVVADLRRYKHERGLALNAPMGRVAIFSAPFSDDSGDASRALNAPVEWHTEPPRLEKAAGDVQFNMAVVGPALRKDAAAFMKAVRVLPEGLLANPPAAIDIGGKEVPVPRDSFSLQFTYRLEGEQVDVRVIDGVIATIHASP